MMDSISYWRATWRLLALSLVLVCPVVGCGPGEQIRSYTVPKEVKPQAALSAPSAEVGEPTHRMLAAILPAGDQAWFFKVVGPLAEIDKRAEELTNFFTGVRLAENGRAKWELPTGWNEQGPTDFRAATIMVPADDKPLEITVTTLGWTGTPNDLLANVNRWRGQMQLPPIGPQQVSESTREIRAGDATMTLVDLRGRFQGGPMAAPFAGGGPGAANQAGQNRDTNLPAGHPPIDAAGNAQRDSSPPPAADVPKFAAPASWQPMPGSEFRKAAFQVADGAQKALITVIDFRLASGAMIADPLQNVNRWRQEIGLATIEKDALDSAVEPLEIGGQPATFVRIVPDPAKPEESKIDEATLAAMVTSGDRIWFFKMKGDRDLVAAHEDEFKTFLKSVRFADAGARNGNE